MNASSPDIIAILSKTYGTYNAEIHFNLLKSSQTINSIQSKPEFVRKVTESINSSSKQVAPLPGASSASAAKFQPTDLRINNSEKDPLPSTEFDEIKAELQKAEEDWHNAMLPEIQ